MYKATYIKYPLKFHTPAGTSRGILTEKDSWFIRLSGSDNPEIAGIGECSLIPGLSFDDIDNFELKLDYTCKLISQGEMEVMQTFPDFPSIQFGLETAFLDLNRGGKRILFPSEFTSGLGGIPLNGLIWMGDRRSMLEQISIKIDQGFRILKMKVGAIKFQEELEILHTIRTLYDRPDLEIRLDANGAWRSEEAPDRLNRLSEYHIHSVEQPIAKGQIERMALLCKNSPIDIALDEELIGVSDLEGKRKLLASVKPAHIIIKPGLLGGFSSAAEWIRLAVENQTGWWITSALESNVGLNAIAQWTATFGSKLPHGLGTGQLFANNFPSPLEIKGDQLWHMPDRVWDLSHII